MAQRHERRERTGHRAEARWLRALPPVRDGLIDAGAAPGAADRAVLRAVLAALARAAGIDPCAVAFPASLRGAGVDPCNGGPPPALGGDHASRGVRSRARPAAAAVPLRPGGVATVDPVDLPPPPSPAPELLGRAREALLHPAARRAAGAHYTPAAAVEEVVALARAATDAARPVVLDPAVGGGAFLLGAARALHAAGVAPAAILRRHLIGVDTDALAVEVAAAALALWAAGAGAPGARADGLRVGDFLAPAAGPPPAPAVAGAAAVDVVVGNPPFLGQLRRATAHDRERAAALRARFGAAVGGYADGAAAFLLAACDAVRPGGAVALVMPRSFLTARDAAGARRAVLGRAALESLWVPEERVFGAAVDVCAPVLRVGAAQPATVRRHGGGRRVAVPFAGGGVAWGALAAAGDAPPVELGGGPPLGREVTASATFRDEYYGVAPHVVDDEGHDDAAFPPLVTSGLIDPARSLWGARPARFARRAWAAPRVERAALGGDPRLVRWAGTRLVPKVLVATQTRVVEAVVDERGAWLPSTPVISVVADPDRLWHVAAVLLAPAVSAWAVRHCAGASLSAGGVKLRAAQVEELPCPRDPAAWDAAADAVRRASRAAGVGERRSALLEAGAASTAAYGIRGPAAGALLAWWEARLPAPT